LAPPGFAAQQRSLPRRSPQGEAGLVPGIAQLRPGKPSIIFGYGILCVIHLRGARMKYVYILECIAEPERHYTGVTDDLKERLKAHNSGKVYHTAKFKPWRLRTYTAFSDAKSAVEFEKYLKSHSGRAFARKRL
jgi:predicted GIY-YIG superfamily endonuclease